MSKSQTMQYTVRAIPTKLDQVIRARAQATGKSLNEVIIEAMSKGSGLTAQASFSDLDWFVGSHSLASNTGSNFDEALDWLNAVPADIN